MKKLEKEFFPFDRNFFQQADQLAFIGDGDFGGKASGLAAIKKSIGQFNDENSFPEISLRIPRLIVLRTDLFDQFMKMNKLYELVSSETSDQMIVHNFLKADLPVSMLGDLRSIAAGSNQPLAVRSSSLLEDEEDHPFAGVYATKMIANNLPSHEQRFHKLTEAVKFVYASTFFSEAKNYLHAINRRIEEEKMAVIIQEVVGDLVNNRFYPYFSGVGRSFNFYPFGKSKPRDGIIHLAIGLGKTIVDGGLCWMYPPNLPKHSPPFASPKEISKQTQKKFFAVRMGKIDLYDPLKESEYLVEADLADAEYDDNLRLCASTFVSEDDKIVIGVGREGERIINFAPLLQFNEFNFNNFIARLLNHCKKSFDGNVEIEFACAYNRTHQKLDVGFLQIRKTFTPSETVDISDDEISSRQVLIYSNKAIGNGIDSTLCDVVYLKPEKFDKNFTNQIAIEISNINKKFLEDGKKYLLIGFGRWGSQDRWLGVPVNWSDISNAKVIVEATLPDMNIEFSQGSHFFHNLSSFRVLYYFVHHDEKNINWKIFEEQKVIEETDFIKHVRFEKPFAAKVDASTLRGIISL